MKRDHRLRHPFDRHGTPPFTDMAGACYAVAGAAPQMVALREP